MKILHWRPIASDGSLRGAIELEFDIGLQVCEVLVHAGGPNGAWVSLPGRPQIDKAGTVRRTANGKIEYARILKWRDRETTDRFSAALIRLLLHDYPDALERR